MSTSYVTLVDQEDYSAAVGTIALEALGDPRVGELVAHSEFGALAEVVAELVGADAAVQLLPTTSAPLEGDELRSLVGSALGAESIEAGLSRMRDLSTGDQPFDPFVDALLASTVLAEHSEAAAMTAAGAVGAATAGGTGSYMAALVTGAHFSGVVLLIAGTGGVVVIAGAALATAWLTWRFLSHR